MFEQYLTDMTHTDPVLRYEAAQKLGASNDSRAIQPLIIALKDENSKVQYAAFSGLIKLNAGDAAAPILDTLLDNPDSKIWELLKLNIGMRLRAGLLDLLPHGDSALAERISASLQASDLDDGCRALVLRMLGRTGTSDHVEPLIDILLHASPIVQGGAAEALGYIGDARAVAPLTLFLFDTSDELREIAVEALGRIGHPSAVDHVMNILSDENEWVRRAAAVALGSLGDPRAVEPLSAAMNDENSVVQDAASEALRKLSYGGQDQTL
jgi:HEAT repeat protein